MATIRSLKEVRKQYKEKALEAYHSEEYKVALEHALVSSNRYVVIVEGV